MAEVDHAAFYYSVKDIIQFFETHPGPIDYTSAFDERILSKRRIYDVISIFSATNVIIKESKNIVKWQGYEFFKKKYQAIIEQYKVNDQSKSLADIIPSLDIVPMDKLTDFYFLFFPAMRVDRVRIRDVCEFLCRKRGNFATIMCKVYQLTSVLTAMDIIFKTENSGEFRLAPEYNFNQINSTDPLPIATLLNRSGSDEQLESVYEKRRKEFLKVSKENYHHQ